MDVALEQVQDLVNELIRAIPNVIVGLVVFLLFFWVSRWVRRGVEGLSNRAGRQPNIGQVLGRMSQWFTVLLGFLVGAVIMFPNFSPAQVIQLLGISSVAIGFAFRDILTNFLSGIILLWTEPFRIGDQIRSGEVEGTVEDIQTRATVLRTYDERRVVIRELDEQGRIGKPITWLELLSPTNKPPNSGHLLYAEKRSTTIQRGIALVEVDYLHETRSPVSFLPSYPDGEPDAFPYSIIVTNPRPSLEEGIMAVYGIGVDERLPIITVPLLDEDVIELDMGAVYNHTFSSLASFGMRVDYEQPPDNMARYTPRDQERIRARMAAVKESAG